MDHEYMEARPTVYFRYIHIFCYTPGKATPAISFYMGWSHWIEEGMVTGVGGGPQTVPHEKKSS